VGLGVTVVARGGSRNRSGPAPDENSGRSDRRGYKLTSLPAEGYDGPVPEWPLPPYVVTRTWYETYGRDKVKVTEVDEGPTADWAEREAELWAEIWRTPQACAWSLPSEAWRLQSIARWVRQAVLCESSAASAADHGQLHRYADQIGLTTAGLREMGWKVAIDEVADRAADRAEQPKRERRLQSVVDAQ
jgi:hypothetical protein